MRVRVYLALCYMTDWKQESERAHGLPICRANVKVDSSLPTQEEKPFKAKSFVQKCKEQMESVSIFLTSTLYILALNNDFSSILFELCQKAANSG